MRLAGCHGRPLAGGAQLTAARQLVAQAHPLHHSRQCRSAGSAAAVRESRVREAQRLAGRPLAAGAAPAATEMGTQQQQQQFPRQSTLVVGPKDAQGSAGLVDALLVLLPGAMLMPTDYSVLIEALQEQSAGLRLWVACPDLGWPEIGTRFMGKDPASIDKDLQQYGDGLVRGAIEEATQAGFPLQGKLEARCENVFVACHSFSSCWYQGFPMQHCAGAILLGSALDTSMSFLANLAAAPRPLMHVCGQLDGQLRLPRVATFAAGVAPQAAQFGFRRLAQTLPFAVVPGLNHAQFSNGDVNKGRRDIETEVPHKVNAGEVARLMAAFITANHSASAPEAKQQAVDELVRETQHAFELLSPYSEACGRGSLLPALSSSLGGSTADSAALAHAFGGERLPPVNPARSGTAHPGELAVAERFCRDAQQRLLAAGLPAAACKDVRVAVTVHTSLDTFTYSQPLVFPADLPTGEHWVVQVHVFILQESYQPGLDSGLFPQSHQYYLKLKRPGAVAHAMGAEGATDAVISAAEINQGTYEAALAAAPQAFKDVYLQRGKQLHFLPDRDVTAEVTSPVGWMQTPLSFEPMDGQEQALGLTAPCVTAPSVPLPSYEHGPGRQVGVHYIKCLSPAWLMEWVMVEALRR